jgi:hypothetical protein
VVEWDRERVRICANNVTKILRDIARVDGMDVDLGAMQAGRPTSPRQESTPENTTLQGSCVAGPPLQLVGGPPPAPLGTNGAAGAAAGASDWMPSSAALPSIMKARRPPGGRAGAGVPLRRYSVTTGPQSHQPLLATSQQQQQQQRIPEMEERLVPTAQPQSQQTGVKTLEGALARPPLNVDKTATLVVSSSQEQQQQQQSSSSVAQAPQAATIRSLQTGPRPLLSHWHHDHSRKKGYGRSKNSLSTDNSDGTVHAMDSMLNNNNQAHVRDLLEYSGGGTVMPGRALSTDSPQTPYSEVPCEGGETLIKHPTFRQSQKASLRGPPLTLRIGSPTCMLFHGLVGICLTSYLAPATFTGKWIRGELIGGGRYIKVYLALNGTTGEMMAAKQVETLCTAPNESEAGQVAVVQALLKSESETLKGLKHPNIVRYLGFEETPTHFSM